jgi:WD40 repeat protein/serine/threonine protein kinase
MDAPTSSSDRDPLERLAAEFLDRRRRGENLSPSDYAERYPQWAEQILEFFPALEVMEGLKPHSGDHTASFNGRDQAAVPRLERLGDYRILREIGHGGMGVVYEAIQESLGRRVALKILPLHGRVDPVQLERFQLESRSAARLHHAGIVPVYGVGEHQGVHYYVMQYIAGHGLDVILDDLRRLRAGAAEPAPAATGASADTGSVAVARSLLTGRFAGSGPGGDSAELAPTAAEQSGGAGLVGPAPPPAPAVGSSILAHWSESGYYRAVARLGVQVAQALAHAHGQGVLHRDIKPSNLLLDSTGQVWVTDFGLAKLEGSEGPTRTGDIIGTLRYMAPERFEGWSDRRSDLYGLGITLYELLTLRPAFDAGTRGKLIEQVLHEPPPAPRRIDPKVPRDLETIVLKATAKEPAERYATAEALAADLERWLRGEPIAARPVPAWERAVKWARRKPAVAGLVATSGIAALALVGVAVGLVYNGKLQRAWKAEGEQRQRAEQGLYFHRVVLAEQEWSHGNVGRAEQLLDECLVGRRGWEWGYLKRLCHTDLLALDGGDGFVYGVAYSRDGSRLAAACGGVDGKSGTVRVWDARSGREERTLRAPLGTAFGVAFSPDGKHLAASSGDIRSTDKPGEVRVWDVATGREVAAFRGHARFVYRVAFSPDGARVASASSVGRGAGEVKVWDARTGREQLTLRGLENPVVAVAFSPDGARIASADADRNLMASEKRAGVVKLWDAATGREVALLRGHDAGINAVAFSPDGARIASASHDHTVRIWDPTTGSERASLRGHTAQVNAVAYQPDGRSVVSASDDGTVRVWDLATGREVLTLRGHTKGIISVATSPDGARIASGGADGAVKLWDSTADQKALVLRGDAGWCMGLDFDPSGHLIAAACSDRTIRIWDAHAGGLRQVLRGHEFPVHRLGFSPDGTRIAATGVSNHLKDPNELKVWDLATGRAILTLDREPQGPSGGLAFSPDGKRLVAARTGPEIKLWDAATGQQVLILRGHTAASMDAAFSPDGQRIASASWDRTIKLWDAATGREIRTLLGHDGPVLAVAFSPDGACIASAGADNTARIRDARSGDALFTLRGHAHYVFDVAFSPDGARVASAGVDHTAKIWDAATGQQILTLRGHDDTVWGVTFSPDGARVATSSGDGTVRIWAGVRGRGGAR